MQSKTAKRAPEQDELHYKAAGSLIPVVLRSALIIHN